MENQIYRIETKANALEFFIAKTNEVYPYRDIREMGVVVFSSGKQIDFPIDPLELDSLIKYLEECRRYIKNFNSKTTSTEVN